MNIKKVYMGLKNLSVFAIIFLLIGAGITSNILVKDVKADDTESIEVIVLNEHADPIKNFHYNYTKLWSGITKKWCESQEIFLRKENSDFCPLATYIDNFGNGLPQKFFEYERIVPKVWVSVIDLSTDREVENKTLEPGESKITFSGLNEGRYFIRAGTVIQLDVKEEWDTGINVPIAPEQQSPFSLPTPDLVGTDEKGPWECYKISELHEKFIPNEGQHYVYTIFKRYTYNIIKSTYTHIDKNKDTDKAFICLLTDPNRLGEIAGDQSNECEIIEEKQVDETTKTQVIKRSFSTMIKTIIKYKIPKLTATQAGLATTGVTSVIYMGLDPKVDFNDKLPINLAGSVTIALTTAKVGGAVGGPAGAAIAFVVSLVGHIILDYIINWYEIGKIRSNHAFALFDDIFSVEQLNGNSYDVEITPMGLSIYEAYLGHTHGLAPIEQISGEKYDLIESESSVVYNDLSVDFVEEDCALCPFCIFGPPWCNTAPLLYCDAELVIDAEKLEDLCWCIHDLGNSRPEFLDFGITTSSNKEYYDLGETAEISIDIKNLHNYGMDIWLGCSLKDKNGVIYDLPLHDCYIGNSEKITVDMDFDIPLNAEVGQFEIAVNCWTDEFQTDQYNDNLYWDDIFKTYNLKIISPTEIKPTFVGKPSNPNKFNAVINLGLGITDGIFPPTSITMKVDNQFSPCNLIDVDLFNGNYCFEVNPPSKTNEGKYEFSVSISGNEISDYANEEEAIIYSTGSNIDTLTVIDRSGSMSGAKIASARTASSLFVDQMNIGDMIGVASFSSGASVNFPLTDISNNNIKQQAKNKINLIGSGGMTAVGRGLQKGLNQLTSHGNPLHPWSIILLSDGHHNTGIHPNSVLPSIQSNNIRVFTIGLGGGADANLLKNIAHNSGGGGGEYFYSPGNAELATIYNTIAGKIKSESTVIEEQGSVAVGDTVSHIVPIDSSTNVATFTVNWESGNCDMTLIRPDSSTVGITDADVISYNKETTYETYTIDTSSNSGDWIVEITRTHASSLKYSLIVTAKTNLTLSLYTDKSNYYINEPIKIITTLSEDNNPISDAIVSAEITKPDNSKSTILLYDDGNHQDMSPFDGVYSNYFTDDSSTGPYNVKVSANGTLNSESFHRKTTKSVYVQGQPNCGISTHPSTWETNTIYAGNHTSKLFNISSSCNKDAIVKITSTDFSDGSRIISSNNVIIYNDDFTLSPMETDDFLLFINIPENSETGTYTGDIIISSSIGTSSIPITLHVIGDITPPTTNKNVSKPKYGLGDLFVTFDSKFDLKATDDKSGVANTYYRIWYDESWNPEPGTGVGNNNNFMLYANNFSLSNEGIHYLEFYSVDNAGNVENVTNQTHIVYDWWSMFRYDSENSGCSHSSIPNYAHVKWISDLGGKVMASPAVLYEHHAFVGSMNGTVYCLHAEDGSIAWSYQTNGFIRSSPAVVDGRVYIGSSDNYLYCLDALTGNKIWRYETGHDIYSSPTVADDQVFIGSNDGNLCCVDALTGNQMWRMSTGCFIYSSPALSDDYVYVASGNNNVYCVQRTTGDIVWTYQTDGVVFSSPTFANGYVVVGSSDGHVYCLNSSNGSLVWKFDTFGAMISSPAVCDEQVYVVSAGGELSCLNLFDGGVVWSSFIGPVSYSSPAVANGKLVVGSAEGFVYCVDVSDGSVIWSYALGGGVCSSPALFNNSVFIGCDDGGLYCFSTVDGLALLVEQVEVHPKVQVTGGDVHVCCDVFGHDVENVKVNISIPDGECVNVSMICQPDGRYCFSDSFSMLGVYSCVVWASDAAGNVVCSDVVEFEIVANDNVAPVAVDDSYELDRGVVCTVDDDGVLENDGDPDDAPRSLSCELISDVSNGVLDFSDDGSFTYYPEDGFVGNVTFSYHAFDGINYSNVVQVSIEVSEHNDCVADMNDDGKLNAADVRYLAMYYSGDPSYCPLFADGDVNSNGVVNSADIRYLALYLCGDPEYTLLNS